MMLLKVATIFLLVIVVGADKKIELQDIEEDNLKSEKEKDFGESDARSQGSAQGSSQGLVPLEFLKSGILRYFENSPSQQTRYIHQYDVTEPPEKSPSVAAKQQYEPSAPQQAMIGYLSNVPMQIYLVPQYYNEHENSGQIPSPQPSPAYSAPRVSYPTAPEVAQTQTNYIQVPTYVSPGTKTYVQQYVPPPVTYVSYSPQATATPAPTVASILTYQMPVVQYTPTIVAPTSPPKGYHYQAPQYTETNTVDEVQENAEEATKQYTAQAEVTYSKAPPSSDYRYYTSRTPHRDEFRHSSISELPHPNPLLLKGPPPHLSHIPKALPMYRPLAKPVYNGAPHDGYTQRPEPYGPPYKRRPTSLLDSYIPSSVQIEYLKRGFAKDPLEAYEALSSGRHLLHSHNAPRHNERGFLPNQMYHTAAGGVTFGHYKRSPKVDKVQHK